MDAIIISCGAELVTGQCVDTNSAWMSAKLTARGVRVIEHVTVDDDCPRLAAAIRLALGKAELVLLSGGLGPTSDDITREAIAEAMGQPLEENPEAMGQIRAFFDRWGRPMPESNRKQAMIPRGCRVVPNPRGTAPGIQAICEGRNLFAFPGVPGEMKPMFEAEVLPILPGVAATIVEPAVLKCFGISEAKLGEILADLMRRGRNPSVGTTASKAVLSVRVVARCDDPSEAICLRDADIAEIRARLGEVIFGEGEATLAEAVGGLLGSMGKSLSSAESCTGGLVAARITDVAGSSAYFPRGYVTYSNTAKVQLLGVSQSVLEAYGAVSEEVARAMAEGCRKSAGTDYALAITGIAGPTGGSAEKHVGLVFVALAEAAGVESVRLQLGEHLSRDEIRDRACKSALNLLRLRLIREGSVAPKA